MSNTCPDWYSGISHAIPWLLVIFGWWITNNQNNRRETRKEIRNDLNAVKHDLHDLEKSALHYHCAEQANKDLARNIRASIQHIGTSIGHLSLTSAESYTELLKLLRQSITRHNFDTQAHVQQDINSQLILDITYQIDRIIDYLECAFSEKYRRK